MAMKDCVPNREGHKPEELVFKGHTFMLGTVKPGERHELRYPFINKTDHTVTIAQVQTGCQCLTVKTSKMEYKPGEAGDLVVEFDSTGYEYEFVQSMVVKTNPGGVTSYLHVRASVIPRAIAEKNAAPPPKAAPQQ
jgi:hypothetical protein